MTILRIICMVALIQIAESCVNKELPDNLLCTNSDLALSLVSKIDASNCKAIDGQVEVTGTGGAAPYDYKIGDGIYQTNPVFIHLSAGTYSFTTKDTKGCKSTLTVTIEASSSTLSATFVATADNQCQPPHNGSINVTSTGGVLPYQFKLDNGIFGPTSSFSTLQSGVHTVIVKDGGDCEFVLHIPVDRGDTGVSYAMEIGPILNLSCNFSGCHGSGTGSRDWTIFSNVQTKAAQIKTRTGNRSMPIGAGPTLSETQIQRIACWVDDGAKNN